MAATTEFLLERVVHHILKGDPGRALVLDALNAGIPAGTLIADFLWPAMECVQQLHQDGTTTSRILNTATRSLRSLLEAASIRLTREPENGRTVLAFTVPGETSELGAHMLSTLAESHGWRVFFAGAGLSLEELAFSIGQLSPDTILMHGSLAESAPAAQHLIRELRRIRIWPSTQLVVAGGLLVTDPSATWEADLIGRHPLETLELMALWPEYRAQLNRKSSTSPASAMEMLKDSSADLSISADLVRSMMRQHFGKRTDHPN